MAQHYSKNGKLCSKNEYDGVKKEQPKVKPAAKEAKSKTTTKESKDA